MGSLLRLTQLALPTTAFSCGVRSAFKLNRKRLLEKLAIAQLAARLVGMPAEGTIHLKIFGFKTGVLGNTSQHLRPYLIFVMESENHIGPTLSGKDLVRTGFTLDIPADTEKRGENTLRFGG
jgi:hypothetical protein